MPTATLLSLATPVVFAMFVWWFGTGAIFAASRLSRAQRRAVFGLVSLVALAALTAVSSVASKPTPMGAYMGFACAILLWAWHEISFVFGYISGPRRTPCPLDARGWTRFRLATQTLIHHEIALAATVAGLWALSWNSPNSVAPIVFTILWLMRLSAKFSLYAGVPHFSDELMPRELAYLKTYFGSPSGPAHGRALATCAALGAGAAAVLGYAHAWSASTTAFDSVATSLWATIAALAALEHLFLISPVRDSALWRFMSPPTRRPRDGASTKRRGLYAAPKRLAQPSHFAAEQKSVEPPLCGPQGRRA